jgi:molybdate transport system regulatory protein
MSYRRTWLLVDTMNRCWQQPLVATVLGGAKGGGASVTPFGRDVLNQYRDLEQRLENGVAAGPGPTLMAKLSGCMRDGPGDSALRKGLAE